MTDIRSKTAGKKSNKKTEIDLNFGKSGVSDVEGEELDIDQFTIE